MTVGLVFCAVITVFTTAGIMLVLGAQSIEFFRLPEVSMTEFFFGTTLKPDARPAEIRDRAALVGDVHGRRRLVADRAADRSLECDLS